MSQPAPERLGPRRAQVLRHLRESGTPLTVAEIAGFVGLHPNTTRFHLDGLTRAGLVRRTLEQRSEPGRRKVLYQAVPGRGDQYRALAATLVKHFAGPLTDRVDRAQAAGRAWGDELRAAWLGIAGPQESIDRLVQCMADLGYQPAFVAEPDPTVVLRACPFRDLAVEAPSVVCQLHLGLANGLLGPDQPWRATGIVPFATPSTCLLHVAKSAVDEDGTGGPDAATEQAPQG